MKLFGFGSRARGQSVEKRSEGRRDGNRNAALQPVLLTETAQALKIKRWEEREDGEFRGFGSYPGRF